MQNPWPFFVGLALVVSFAALLLAVRGQYRIDKKRRDAPDPADWWKQSREWRESDSDESPFGRP